MNKITALLLFLLLTGTVQAQRYEIFSYNGKEGITDSNGVEVVAPLYDHHDWVEAKQLDVMAPDYGDDKLKVLIFDEKTGTKKVYERFSVNEVHAAGDTFSLVEENGKIFLWSETGDRKIMLTENFYTFQSVGERYIIGKYFPNPLPPGFGPEREYYAVFANTSALPVLLQGGYTSCKPLYAYPKRKQDNYETEIIHINPELTGLLCSDGKTHTLYDSAMKKVAGFTQVLKISLKEESFPPDDKEIVALQDKCSSLLHTDVVFEIPVYPTISDVSSHEPDPALKPEAELVSEETDGGTIVSVKDTNSIITRLFFTKYPVTIDPRRDEVDITPPGKAIKPVMFYVDMDRQKILLPTKYVKLLQLKMY